MIRSWINVLVASKRQEATDIYSFDLVDPQGHELPPFTAGSHIDVQVAPGLVRQYSLCNSPRAQPLSDCSPARGLIERRLGAHGAEREARRSDRDFGARNHFGLEATADRHILLAGGIGVTPSCVWRSGWHTSTPRSRFITCPGPVSAQLSVNESPRLPSRET